MEIYIILAVLILMVIAMATDLFDFGVAPLLACVVLAITGVVTYQEAFAGFTNKYVLVTAAFLVIGAAFGRTKLINKIQKGVMSLQKGKSGMLLYLVLILFTFVIASLMQPGPAALLLVVVMTTLPHGDNKPANSQMMLPLGTLCNLAGAKLPIGITFMLVIWANGFMENVGFADTVSIKNYLLMGILPLIVAIVYSLVAYRMIPVHSISATEDDSVDIETKPLSKFHEIVVYVVFGASTLAMFVSNQLGDLVFLLPIVGVALFVVTGVFNFKETRALLSHPLVFLLAGIFALADIMANKGITEMLGNSIQSALGGTANGWIIMIVFAFATVIMANLTGSNIGTMMIISPIAASTAMAAGLDPRAIVLAVIASASASVIMPMDTAMGVIFARGNYKLATTFKYTIPLTILYICAVCVSAGLIYPL